MEELIDEVLAAGARARKIIEDSHKKEAEIRSSSAAQADKRIEEARSRARNLIQDEVAKAQTAADKEYDRRIGEHEKESLSLITSNKEHFDRIVERIMRLIVTPEHKRR